MEFVALLYLLILTPELILLWMLITAIRHLMK